MITNHRTMLRRDFLAGGVGVAVGICSLGRLRQSTLRAAESSAKSKMRFGLTTYTWGKDWDIPTLITNCEKAGLYGVELRTSLNYAHGVELTLSASQRAAVKQRFADSPVHLVSICPADQRLPSVLSQDHRSALAIPRPPSPSAAQPVVRQFADAPGHRVCPLSIHSHVPAFERTVDQTIGPGGAAMGPSTTAARTRMLGVSNFNLEQLPTCLWQEARVRPRFIQNRCYAVRGWDRPVREFCRANDVVYQGFSLLKPRGIRWRKSPRLPRGKIASAGNLADPVPLPLRRHLGQSATAN